MSLQEFKKLLSHCLTFFSLLPLLFLALTIGKDSRRKRYQFQGNITSFTSICKTTWPSYFFLSCSLYIGVSVCLWVLCLFVYLPLYPFVCVCLCHYVCFCIFVALIFYVSVCLYSHMSPCMSLYVPLGSCTLKSVCLCIFVCMSVYVKVSVYIYIWLCLCYFIPVFMFCVCVLCLVMCL